MLLDEPLVNLDYKLREELRDELSQLFAAGDSTVVYATTEPTEALLLGGYTAVLRRRRAAAVRADRRGLPRAALDPRGARLQRPADEPARRPAPRRTASALPATGWRCAVRAAALAPAARADRRPARRRAARAARATATSRCAGSVELAEISGSDTFVHVDTAIGELVAQLTGVHALRARARRSRCTSSRRRPTCSTPTATAAGSRRPRRGHGRTH